jgi:hypothetical protein
MTIAYVSGSAASAPVNTATITVTAPASMVAGNLLVAVVMGNSGTTTITTPAGWTQAAQENPAGNPGSCAVFTKTATGSEPTSYTFDEPSGFSYMGVAVLQYSGTSGLDVAPAFNVATASTTACTAPSVTPSGSSDTWVTAFCSFQGYSFSTPTGMTARTSSAASNVSVFTFDKGLTSSAATGTAASTQSASQEYVGVSLLLAQPVATVDSAGTVLVG